MRVWLAGQDNRNGSRQRRDASQQRQLSEREVKRRSAPAKLVQVQQSFGTVSLPSRLDVAYLQIEMQGHR